MNSTKHTLTCLIILLFSTVLIAQNKIVDRPDYETSNTILFEINKLEMTDTATVLHCDVYNKVGHDGSIFINSKSYLIGESGQTYKLLRSDGYELDKWVPMPQSGNISFKLFMDPLSKKERSFDFIGGDLDGAFKITGIKTNKTTKSKLPIRYLLKGEVIDRPQSSRLVLTKEGGDERVSAIYIPIRNGKFEYELNCGFEESYELVFFDELMGGGWRPIKFFSDSKTISFKLYPSNKYEMNSIEGGKLNTDFRNYKMDKDSILNMTELMRLHDSLDNANRFFSEKYTAIKKQRNEADNQVVKDSLRVILQKMQTSGEIYTPEANILNKRAEEIQQQFKEWEIEYFKKEKSIVSYSLLVKRMESAIDYSREEIPKLVELFNSIYAKKYPSHPYSEKMENLIKSYSSIKVGGKYIDFVAPSFSGDRIRLSDQIKGKVALIDLWASWCGPCRRSSISMIPVYENYKNKGFTIVGIARERLLSDGINAAKKDNYPWLNLTELNDEERIWEKYGLGNSGGGTFLVDKDGAILAINPSPEEVKVFLNKLLGK